LATRTRSPSDARTAGSSVSEASATAATDRIMPSAMERNTMTGTRNTAASGVWKYERNSRRKTTEMRLAAEDAMV
jgi:hypothetical protein